MPEGPTIVILKEAVSRFEGQEILGARGNAKIDMQSLVNKRILRFRSWGKQFFICTEQVNVRIHFLMFGSYSIDEQIRPDRSLRLALTCTGGTLYFYTCAVKILEGNLDTLFDWEADVMTDLWKPLKARKKLKQMPGTMVCDALLDQQVFSGVGNIIKNEVLYRIKLHPETLLEHIPPRKITELIREARNYSFDFLAWKKEFVLRQHWLAHTKRTCLRCNLPFVKKHCGATKRRSFFCTNCQVMYEM